MATNGAAIRISVRDETHGGAPFEVFDVVAVADDVLRVRSPYLFEIGEELAIRVEGAGTVYDAQVRVRAHVGPRDARTTELEILERSAQRPAGSG